jgi:iron complex outermembrane receptor protein
MRTDQFRVLILGAVAPLGVGFAQQPAADAGLEEVTVTAERRAENLQNVPVTVTAVSSEQLAESGITDVMQLSNLVPSFSAIDPTGYTMLFIRGVGSSTLGAGTFASVATYIDGVYIARTTNSLFELDSVESVQVLAGPQGSLYGRNATAGAVVITSATPKIDSDLGGSVGATLGTYGNRTITGSISGGFAERWAFGLTAAKHDRDGFVKNLNPAGSLNTEDLDDRDSISGRATLVFEPSDTASYALRLSYNKSDDHAGGGYEPVGIRANSPGAVPGFPDIRSVFFGGIAQGFAPLLGPALAATVGAEAASALVFTSKFGETYDNQRSGFTNGLLTGKHTPGSSLYIENIMASLNANFEFDRFTLRSVTGYTDSDYHGSVQVSLERPGSATSATLGAVLGAPGPVPLNATGGLGFSSINPSKVISQGFQFLSKESSRLKWIAGVDYSDEDGKAVLTGDSFGSSQYSADNDWSVQSMAAFGQLTFPLGDALSATFGGRYSDETYEINDNINPNPATIPMGYTGPTNPNTLPGVAPLTGRFRDKNSTKFTYTARLEHKSDEALWFGGISSGFKSATLNVNSPLQGEAEPEDVRSFEMGYKRDFGSRYRFNASAYVSQYDGIQLNVIVQATGANFLTNGPAAEVKGVDLSWEGRLTDNFKMTFATTLLDAKFTENKPANAATGTAALNIKGNKLPGAADFAATLVGDYSRPLSNGGKIGIVGTLVHNSGKYYEHLNLTGSGGATSEAYTILNLNLGYTAPDDKWSVSVWGNNVRDEEYYRTGIIWAGTLGRDAIAGNPAHYGVTAKFNF